LPGGGATAAIEPKSPPLVPFTPAAKNKVFGSPTFLAPKTPQSAIDEYVPLGILQLTQKCKAVGIEYVDNPVAEVAH
jgi:hypothetical protein